MHCRACETRITITPDKRGIMMKKLAALCVLPFIALSFSCKKTQQGDQVADAVLAKKYARYRVAVNKEPELKTWLATLEKGEDVDLLKEETITTGKKAQLVVSKVKLAGGEEGYIESRHLADKTIIFTEDTPAFNRPTMGSRLVVKMPRGTIAFVVGEQANWVKIYAGKVGDTYVSNQWVQGGFTADPQLLVTARLYESALGLIASHKEDERKSGREKMMELAGGSGIFAELAQAKLAGADKTEQAPAEKNEQAAEGAGQEKATQPAQ